MIAFVIPKVPSFPLKKEQTGNYFKNVMLAKYFFGQSREEILKFP